MPRNCAALWPLASSIQGGVYACRMLLTAVVIAIKFIEDECFVNSHYAKVGGVEVPELNHMELMMCSLLDFRFNLTGGDPSIVLKQV